MAIQFRDESNEDKKPKRDNSTDAAMEELRELFKRERGDDPLTDDEIASRFGPDAPGMVARVQKRLSELVDAMNAFNMARKNGADVAEPMMKLTKLLGDTMQRYNAMEISSMLATGIAAISEIEVGGTGDD